MVAVGYVNIRKRPCALTHGSVARRSCTNGDQQIGRTSSRHRQVAGVAAGGDPGQQILAATLQRDRPRPLRRGASDILDRRCGSTAGRGLAADTTAPAGLALVEGRWAVVQ